MTTKLRQIRISCDQCQMLSINGMACHEFGCPSAWKDEKRKCQNCGCDFIPLERPQKHCSAECAGEYYT